MYKWFFQVAMWLAALALPMAGMGASTETESNTFDGYTLVAPNFHTTTYLIDMDGNVVHYWLNDGTPALSAYLLENGNLLRTSTVAQQEQTPGAQGAPRGRGFGGGMPGGMGGMADRGGGAGGRIQEIDWEGNVVWEFRFENDDHITHHDVEIMPNGHILCIAWERKTTREAIDAGRDPAFQGSADLRPDFIIEVKPDKVNNGGEIVWQWHAWDHLIQDFDKDKANYGEVAAHPELIDVNFTANRTVAPSGAAAGPARGGFGGMGGFGGAPGRMGGGMTMMGLTGAGGTMPPDWMHTNAIDYNADLDQIAISCYGFSEIWIIDHSTTTEEARGHTGGKQGKGGDLIYRWGNPRAYRAGTEADQKFFNQHDVHWIPEGRPGAGHLLVFNNGPYRPDGDYSSVDEIVTPVDANGHYPLDKGTSYGPVDAVWSYAAPNKSDFFSMHISGAERQPNGNTLICSGAYGVFFEVTPDKEVVWRCAYTGGDSPEGPDLTSGMGGMGGFGMPNRAGGFGGGGRGGFPGMPGAGGAQPTATAELPRFAVTREDPAVSGLQGMPASLPKWGGGTGFGVTDTQTFRVYRYPADYPGLTGKKLIPIDKE